MTVVCLLKLLPDIEFIVTAVVNIAVSAVTVTVVISWFCQIFRCVASISSLHLPSNK